MLPRLPGGGLAHNYEGVYALGLALFAFGLADVTWGNGLIAAFVAGVGAGRGRARRSRRVQPVQRERQRDLPGDHVLPLRRADRRHTAGTTASWRCSRSSLSRCWSRGRSAVLLALAGTGLPQPHKLFIAWFGPKGVASMLFALLVLNSAVPHHALVFEIGLVRDHRLDRRARPDRHRRHALDRAPDARADRRACGSEQEGVGAALVPEDERELLRRPQPVRVRRPERRAGLLLSQRAEHVLVEEAVLAARLRWRVRRWRGCGAVVSRRRCSCDGRHGESIGG